MQELILKNFGSPLYCSIDTCYTIKPCTYNYYNIYNEFTVFLLTWALPQVIIYICIARVSYYRVFLQWKEWGDPDHEGCAPCNPIQISPLFQPIWYGFCRIVIRPCLFKQTLKCWIMVCSACFFYQSSKVLLLFRSWMVFVWGPHHRQLFSPLIFNVSVESLVLNWNRGFSNNYSHLKFFLKICEVYCIN